MRNARTAVVTKINRPRERFLKRNCPSPGRMREEKDKAAEFRDGAEVVSEVVMNYRFRQSSM
jgi:hypothetical protein